MRKISIILITVIVAFTLLVALFTFTRREYESVVLDRFGDIVPNPPKVLANYNWYVCWPTDRVVRMDTRLHLYQSILQQVNTAGSEPIAVKTFAAWQIVDAVEFYRKTGGSDVRGKQLVDQKIQGLVTQVLPGHRLDEIFNTDEKLVKTDEVEETITKMANEALAEQGIKVARVGFSRMAFPPQVANSVYARMRAERDTLANVFASKGQAEALRISNEGQTNARIMMSQAEAEAQKTRGDGDSKALEILTSAQPNQDARDFYQYWKSVDTFKNALSKNAYLVLSTDNPMLRPIFTAPRTGDSKVAEQPAAPAAISAKP